MKKKNLNLILGIVLIICALYIFMIMIMIMNGFGNEKHIIIFASDSSFKNLPFFAGLLALAGAILLKDFNK